MASRWTGWSGLSSLRKLGAEIFEIDCSALVSIGAHGRERCCPALVEVLDTQAFKSSATREVRPGFLHGLMVHEGLCDGVDAVVHGACSCRKWSGCGLRPETPGG